MVEKYISLSLDDERTAKVAEILSNKTCKKILDYLAEKDASESEVSKDLEMPLNTVGYNIKKLKKEGLIEEKSHFWSLRGKRIPVYRVSNKKIIITPKSSMKEKLKYSLPVILLTGVFTFFMLWYSKIIKEPRVEETIGIMTETEATTGFLSSLGILEGFLIVVWIGVVIFVGINLRRDK